MNNLITPYGGALLARMASAERIAQLKQEARDIESIDISHRQASDVELLINGAYSPLAGYMGRADYESVAKSMQLADGSFWPVPIALEVSETVASTLKPAQQVALRDPEGFMLAVLTIGECWADEHGTWRIGGKVEGVALPQHHDFNDLRLTPEEMRRQFARRGWHRVVAYQPDGWLYRAQADFVQEVARSHEASLLLHPVAGEIPADEVEYFARLHSFQAVLPRFPAAVTALAMLPLPPHGGGLRSALLKAIVARNFGCTHVVAEGATEAELAPYSDVLGVRLIGIPPLAYVVDEGRYFPAASAPAGAEAPHTRAEVERRLEWGLDLPESFADEEIANELRKAFPPRNKQGICVFFTGFSGSGKSTLAKALMVRLLELGGRQVTLLDGDVVRKHLSSELGFSREHRDLNIRRIGYVASEIVKHRGIAICAPIAPYQATRRYVRQMIEQYGGFFEIHVATPIETCEARDRKGLYAKARAGIVKEFTGVSDPYEVPEHPELAIDTSNVSVDEAVQRILLKLEREGYLR